MFLRGLLALKRKEASIQETQAGDMETVPGKGEELSQLSSQSVVSLAVGQQGRHRAHSQGHSRKVSPAPA